MKIATHIFGVLGFLGAVSGQAISQSTGSGLSELWKITDPDPSISPSTQSVAFAYDISTQLALENLDYKVFSDVACTADEAAPATDFNSLITQLGLTFQGTYVSGLPTLDVSLIPAELTTTSPYYSEESINGQIRAKIQFCIRFSLILPGTTEVEVNFQESIIIIFVDLTDGFTVTGINVAPKERLIRTSTQAYEVVASLCTPIDSEAGGALNQGSVVCVQVVPEDEAVAAGLVMRLIDSFTFKATVGGVTVEQPAVLNGAAVDLLTAHASCDGLSTCEWSTILKAAFYEPIVGGGSRSVTGDGVATMKFGVAPGARRLGEDGRELQEEDGAGASEFDLNFDINPAAPVDESSAATVAYGLVAALLGLSMVV